MITNKNTDKKEQARVIITEDEANEMNVHSPYYKVRYVEGKDAVNITESTGQSIEDARAEYLEVVGKKAFGGWDLETIKQKQEENSK